jgi:PIN domain nuclease of toxin-antitoxin system
MRLLLDTHVFLWYISGDVRVERGVRHAIENADVVF